MIQVSLQAENFLVHFCNYIYNFIFIAFEPVWNFQCKMNAVREAAIEADENAAE